MITEKKETDLLLQQWIKLRETVEISDNPLEEVTQFFLQRPHVKVYTDPYDQATWPTPWELVTEDRYCPFNLLLGICYTLQLTERFSQITPDITIAVDSYSKTLYYLLNVDNNVFGFLDNEWCLASALPKTLIIQKKIRMGNLH